MILVTAANGRTGRSLVGALGRASHNVRAFDIDRDVEQLVGERGASEAVVGDPLNPGDVRRAVDGARFGRPHLASHAPAGGRDGP